MVGTSHRQDVRRGGARIVQAATRRFICCVLAVSLFSAILDTAIGTEDPEVDPPEHPSPLPMCECMTDEIQDGPQTDPTFPGGLSLEAWQAAGHDADSVLADPGFLDSDGFDFRLAEDSPARKLGFQPIDMSTVGLTGPSEWVELPKQAPRPEMVMPSP